MCDLVFLLIQVFDNIKHLTIVFTFTTGCKHFTLTSLYDKKIDIFTTFRISNLVITKGWRSTQTILKTIVNLILFRRHSFLLVISLALLDVDVN